MTPSETGGSRSAGALAALALALALGVADVADVAAQTVTKATFMAEGSFALPASGPGAVPRPRAIAWAAPNQVHVADERGTVVVLDGASGAFVRSYGTGTLQRVAGLAVDAEGRAYVLDPEQKIVVVFDAAGEVLHRIGSPGGEAGLLQEPVDVALGPTGLVHVLDRGRRGVQVFSMDGTFVHDLMLAASAQDARALGVTPSGRVFLAAGNLSGALLRLPELTAALGTVDAPAEATTALVRGARLEQPVAVVSTPTGTVVAADRETGVLWAIDAQGGAPVGSDDRLYGGSGSGRGSFRRLEDAALAGADQLVILDGEGRKVERVRLLTEEGRAAERVLDYPVLFEAVEPALEGGVLATAPRRTGTTWFALADVEGRNLRVVEARMVEARGAFGTPVRRPEVVGAPHSFGLLVERAGHVAMNDTLLVVTEPRRNRFHVFDLRTDAQIGAFGDGYSDARRLRSPRGVALFADGRVTVADHDNDRVAVFSADLTTLLRIFPLPGAEGVAISAEDRLFAWDEAGLRVGELPVAGGPFEPLIPAASAGGVAAMTADAVGNVYVLRRRSSRVAVLNPGMGRLLARMGPQRGLENGDHLAVDGDGNVHATDLARAATVTLRWGVDVPPIAAVAARWEPGFAELSWDRVPGSFVAGYQVEGAATEDGPWSRVAAPTEPTARVQDPGLRWYRVAPRTLTGGLGLPSPGTPVAHLAAAAAFAAGDWDRTRTLAREALATLEARAAEATPAAVQALEWAGFVAAYEARDFEDALAWQRLVENEPPAGKAFEHLYRVADAHHQLGDVQAAVFRATAGLAVAAREPGAPAAQVAALRQIVFAGSWDLGELDRVASMGEEIVRASPESARDAAFVERLARAQLETGAPRRAVELLEPLLGADPAAAPRRLLVMTFMAAAALEDYPRALQLADAAGDRMDADLFIGFQGTLARVRLQTDDLLGARAELAALLADPRDRHALADPAVARSLLAVYATYVEAGDSEGGRALVDSMVAVLPPELADLRASVLQRADSAALVADTRAKLGEGFQHYRDARFRDALRFFQQADDRTDLDLNQRLIVKELLAGTFYSLTRVADADNVYRGVFEIDPRFNLADHRERMSQLYGVSVFTDEMVAHFLEIAP